MAAEEPLIKSSPSAEDLDPERCAAKDMQRPITWWAYSLHAVRAASHLLFIATAVWAAVAPGELEDAKDTARFAMTLLLTPPVIYETAKHWWNGTFFPMTASDSFHIIRFGTRVNRNPPHIRCGTLLAMVWLGAFFSILSYINLAIAASRFCAFGQDQTCVDRFWAMSTFGQWQLRLQYYSLLVSAVLHVKTVALTTIFICVLVTGVSLLGVLTFGYAWVVLVMFCFKGFNRNSKILCLSCALPYDFVSLFYRNL